MAPPAPGIKVNEDGIPEFEDLPLRKGDPPYSAWGLYGDSDELGTLNRLTDERVAAAAKSEIRSGVRISLNWELGAQTKGAFFGRQVFHQDMYAKAPHIVNDEVWTFNSQVSSQWDGLRHFGYQREARFYNGVTLDQIHAVDEHGKNATVNGIHAWAEKGIVGRGVLVDFEAWRLQQGRAFDHFATEAITLADLKACLAAQDNTEVRFGDILIIRSGWMAAFATKSEAELAEHRDLSRGHHTFGGVEQSEELLGWIWRHFSAVAGDQPSFECWPSKAEGGWYMHERLLAGFGCPIGELFHLEALAEHCRREKRWSFFVTSEPCNVVGGVASPPNILAIF